MYRQGDTGTNVGKSPSVIGIDNLSVIRVIGIKARQNARVVGNMENVIRIDTERTTDIAPHKLVCNCIILIERFSFQLISVLEMGRSVEFQMHECRIIVKGVVGGNRQGRSQQI